MSAQFRSKFPAHITHAMKLHCEVSAASAVTRWIKGDGEGESVLKKVLKLGRPNKSQEFKSKIIQREFCFLRYKNHSIILLNMVML